METTVDQTTADSTREPLARAVAANAGFSLVSGAGVTALAVPLADLADLPVWLVLMVGIGVILFGLSLAIPMRTAGISRALGRTALAADAAWVVAAVTLIAAPNTMSGAGKVVLAAITVFVAGFGAAEWRGLRRLANG